MNTWEDWWPTRVRQKARRGPKTVSTAALWQRTQWLETRFEWREAAVQFFIDEQWRIVDSSRLARTGRALRTLGQRVKGDDQLRLARRENQFGLAQRLSALNAPDLAVLCSVSRRRNQAALERLGELLLVEALSLTALGSSPAGALQRAWPHSRSVLFCHLNDEGAPWQSRALAAWSLGVCGESNLSDSDAGLRRVARLAQHQAALAELDALVPAAAALYSESLFWRLVACQQNNAHWKLTPQQWRYLTMAEGAEKAVEIAEFLANLPDLWPELPSIKTWLRPDSILLWPAQWREEVRKVKATLQPHLVALAVKSLPAAEGALHLMQSWMEQLFDLPARLTSRQTRQAKTNPQFAIAMPVWWLNELGEFLAQRFVGVADHDDPYTCVQVLKVVSAKAWEEVKAKQNGGRAPSLQDWNVFIKASFEENVYPALRICKLGVANIVMRLIELDALKIIPKRGWPSKEWWPVALYCAEQGIRCTNDFYRVFRRQDDFAQGDDGAKQALKLLRQLFEATLGLEQNIRASLVSAILYEVPLTRVGTRELLPAMVEPLRHLSVLLQRLKTGFSDDRPLGMTSSLCRLVQAAHQEKLAAATRLRLCDILCETIFARKQQDEIEDYYEIETLALHNAMTGAGFSAVPDEECFKRTLEAAWLKMPSEWSESQELIKGVRALRDLDEVREEMQFAVESLLKHRGKQGVKMLRRFASLGRSGDLGAIFNWGAPDDGVPYEWKDVWQPVLDQMPQCEAAIETFIRWHQRTGVPVFVPKGILKILESEDKLRQEWEFLTAKPAPDEKIRLRLSSLQQRIAEQGTPARQAQKRAQIEEILADATARAASLALHKAVIETARRRLFAICGTRANELEIDADWLNALLLACQIEDNRKWAREILKRRIVGETHWRQELPNNARFLKQLQERQVQTAHFLHDFHCEKAGFEFWIERDPLGILQMGNRFNTCLSRGGCNEHSSIANAIDLNKIVVYARDAKGVIVGRQLWAVSEAFELVGFYVYSTLEKEPRWKLENAFSRCAEAFAAGCGLRLSDKGKVASLVVPHWYDDGVWEWEKPIGSQTQTKSARPSPVKGGLTCG